MAEETLQDDLSIPDTDRLFRRVPPNQLVLREDGSRRPSSSVFKHERMSVNIESLMVAQARAPEDTLKSYPGHFLTSVIVGDVRRFAYPIVKDTEPPNDPAHGIVLGKKRDSFANSVLGAELAKSSFDGQRASAPFFIFPHRGYLMPSSETE